jgi:hypothetical protein
LSGVARVRSLSTWEWTVAMTAWGESTVVESGRVILCKNGVVVLFERRPYYTFRRR